MAEQNTALKVSSLNNVKIYHCTAGKSISQFLKEYKGREGSLRYNDEYRNRIEVIQDFDMPIASTRIKISPDGRYIAALGTYKPRIRIYDTTNLSMKVEKVSDADLIQMQFLSDDYSKLLLARNDRTIEVHAPSGLYTTVRVPKFMRDLYYHRPTCDAYIACNGPEVYRLNLEQGSFLAPLHTSFEDNVNVIGSSPVHPILAFGGGSGGRVECWDPRDRTRAAILDIPSSVIASHPAIARAFSKALNPIEVTALRFDDSGMNLSVGTNNGQILTYDIRAGAPFFARDHKYGTAVHSIKYHESSNKLISADSKVIRIWDKTSGDAFTSIQPPCAINDVTVVENSGMIMMAGESPQMHIYYVPALGSVPDWCAHLEGLTEELEETNQNDTYDNYKFVTREQLQDWGLAHLIGTNLLKAYMHGFFMDSRLYDQVRSIAEPENYDSYVKDQVRRKIDDERSNRIAAPLQAATVNTHLAEQLTKKKKKSTEPSALEDSRFASLFDDEDFTIDQDSEEFRRLNPHIAQQEKQEARRVVSGEVKTVHKPTGDNSMMDLLQDEANPLFSRQKKEHESQGLLDAAGLGIDDDDQINSKELRKREKAEKLAKAEKAHAEKVAAEARELLQEQKMKDRLSLFANSIAGRKDSTSENKLKMRSVRSGVGVGDVLASGKRAAKSFSGMALGQRVDVEEKQRVRLFVERERDKRQKTRDEKRSIASNKEAKKLSRRSLHSTTYSKEHGKTKGSKNEYR